MNIFSLSIAGALLIILQVMVTINIVLNKDDVKSSIGWIGLIWLSPLFGTVIYIIFGINRIKRKAVALKNSGPGIVEITEDIYREVDKSAYPNFTQLLKLGYSVHPQYFTLGNKITPLLNGDSAYPSMCAAISAAKHEVLLESYIFNNDAAGTMILDAAKKAILNGAKVKMLIDGIGLNYSKPNIAQAARKIPGLEFGVFLPSKKPIALPFVNLRNHRKLITIDGHTAFFGGMNIAADNLLAINPKNPVTDITFKIEGPVAAQMASMFLQDWIFAKKQAFEPFKYIAADALGFDIPCRIIPDGPDSDYGKVEAMLLGAITCAKNSISILTPYFLPETTLLTTLETAAMRGVDVQIILPNKSNIFGMDWAMRANFERLINKGIKIYLTKAPFDHSKIFVMDNYWCFVGSANWDIRSLKLNFESNMEFLSEALAQQLNDTIRIKQATAMLVKIEPQNVFKKLRDNSFKLLTPYY